MKPLDNDVRRITSAAEFEQLVDLYYRDLYRFAFSLTQNSSDAADLTQQTFYRWGDKGHQLRDQGRVKSWLFTTLHREFLQTRRRQVHFPHLELSQVEEELPRVAPESIEKIDAQTVLILLSQIDEDHRAPLILYYIDDLPYKEIAMVLDLPLGTVQSRIARGKARLYRLLTTPTAGADKEVPHG